MSPMGYRGGCNAWNHGPRVVGRHIATIAVAAVALTVVLIAVPGAQAQTVLSAPATNYVVQAGDNHPPAGTPPQATLNGYYPHTVFVRAGDSVTFKFAGFHSVTFPVSGQEVPDIAQIDATHQYTGYNDAAGSPFWFNNGPSFAVPADRWQRVGGATAPGSKSCSGNYSSSDPSIEDGTQLRGSGFPLDGTSAPADYTLCFPKVGTYAYGCLIHRGHVSHGMFGQVVVVPRDQSVPSPAQQSQAGATQIAADYQLASSLDSYDPGGNTISLGHDSGDVALLRPFPLNKTVTAGSSVTFSLSSGTEVHMAALGPELYRDANESKFVQFPDGTAALNPMVFFPSDPPPAGPRPPYTGTNHGNGWETSGVLNSETPDPSRPSSLGSPTVDVTFSAAGDYVFECLIHPGMEGTIHVV
jgi:plastocyanin